jgi:hypothetical protein
VTFPVPGGATFLRARSNLADVASAAAALADLGGLVMVASTGVAGFALQNATPTILTWTAPNDGNLHRVFPFAAAHITVAETGGAVTLNYTLPDGFADGHTVIAANQAAGDTFLAGALLVPVKAGSTVTIAQATALTVGACTVWAELWAL